MYTKQKDAGQFARLRFCESASSSLRDRSLITMMEEAWEHETVRRSSGCGAQNRYMQLNSFTLPYTRDYTCILFVIHLIQ